MNTRYMLQAVVITVGSLTNISLATATDLVDAYQLAVANDARLQSANFEFQASSEAITQARAELLPELTFEASRTWTDQEIISSDNTVFATGGTDFTTNTYNLNLNIPIFRYDAWKRFAQSKSIVKQAKAELLAAKQTLMFDTAEAYFNILAAKDNLDYSQAEKQAVGRQLELAQERLKEGLATAMDLSDAQARYATSESQEIESENQLEDAYRRMQEHTAEFLVDFSVLRNSIPLLEPDSAALSDWIDAAASQNYALEALRHAITVAEEERNRQQAGHMPKLDLVGSINNRDTDGSLFGGGSEVQTKDVMLRFSMPLFSGGRTWSASREAGFRYQQAKRDYEAERRSLERETRAAYRGILSGINKVEALGKSVEFQRSALELKSAGLDAGINTMLAVLDAQRDLYFAQRDLSQARYDYLLSVLRLKRASGSLSPEDLERLNSLLTTG